MRDAGVHLCSAYEEKLQKPDDRLKTKFTAGNSRSAQSPAVNLTPAARFLVFLTYAIKSVNPRVPHFPKSHPTGGILLFSPHIRSAVSLTIPDFKKEEKTRAVSTAADWIHSISTACWISCCLRC